MAIEEKEPKTEQPQKPKKPKRKIIRNALKSVINPRKWVRYDAVVDNTKFVAGLFKDTVSKQASEQEPEIFDEAIQRLKISEEDLTRRKRAFLIYSMMYFGIGLGLFAYFCYLLFMAHLLASLMSLALMFLAFAYAMRENFWYMQMKKRKLGCSLGEWFKFICRKT